MSRAAALALVLVAACARAPAAGPAGDPAAPAAVRVEEAPRALQPPLARADAAVRTLRERLAARLAAELASGGVAAALKVCRTEAPELLRAVSRQTGVELGRTGLRARNGSRPPRPWAAPLIGEATARRASEVPALAVDLGDRVGLLRPIALTALCLACHGSPERVLPEMKTAADGAAEDRSGGSSEGDLRGFYWAEAVK
jgi:hypothetical protein